MFRSTVLAVLAIALSSSAAAAQGAWPDRKTLLELGNKLAQQTTTDSDHSGFTVSYEVKVSGDDRQMALYSLQGALQTLDAMTTAAALSAGNREANPLMGNGNPTAMVIAKSAAMGLHVFAVEHLEKRSPKTAMWMMIATNAAMFAVVANNTAVIRR